ncbi:MAG: hypothetical protein Tsb009_39310 [Planctomycetaceae bacterium]
MKSREMRGEINLVFRKPFNNKGIALTILLLSVMVTAGCQGKSKKESKTPSANGKTSKTSPSSVTQKTKTPEKTTPEVKTPAKTKTPEKTPKTTIKKEEVELTPEQKAFADALLAKKKKEAVLKQLEELGAAIKTNNLNEVIHVDFRGTEAEDKHLALLKIFPYLRNLNLSGVTKITDKGIKELESLEYLTELYLYGTGIKDEALKTIGKFSRLQKLCLDQTQITDAGLKHLEKLPELQSLCIRSKGEITDKAVSSVVKIRSLRKLKIGGTKITAVGKRKLRVLLPRCVVDTMPPE